MEIEILISWKGHTLCYALYSSYSSSDAVCEFMHVSFCRFWGLPWDLLVFKGKFA